MVKEDILRGLQVALSKGESLEQAMYTFYNAGYNKEDVEEAAQALQTAISQQQPIIQSLTKTNQQVQPTPQQKSAEQIRRVQFKSQQVKPELPKVVQNVSGYEEQKPEKKINLRTIMIIILSVVLVLLFGALISVFIFREGLLSSLNNLF